MGLKLIQWNIRGYKNNYNELLHIIQKHIPHIICIQETHLLNTDYTPHPNNYTLINTNNTNTRYGGVAFLIHNSVQYKTININNQIDINAIEVTHKTTITIVNV